MITKSGFWAAARLVWPMVAFSLAFLLLVGLYQISRNRTVPKPQSDYPSSEGKKVLESDLPPLEGKGILENIERQSKILKEANEFGISYVTDLDEGEKFIQRIRQNADLHKALELTKKKAKVLYIHDGKLCLPWEGAIESIALTENDKEIIGFLLDR